MSQYQLLVKGLPMSAKAIFLPLLLLLTDAFANAASLEVAADEWCPVNCQADDINPGYAVEVLRLVFAQNGINYRVLPWKRAVLNVQKGLSAAVIGAGEDITEREGLQIGHEPIGYIYDCLYVTSGSPVKYRGQADDLNPLQRLGIGLGYIYTEGFKAWMERPENAHKIFSASGDQPGMRNLRKLVAGSLDGMIEAGMVMDYQLHKAGLASEVVSVGCDTPQPIYVAFGPKGSQGDDLVKQFDQGMAELHHSGRLTEILDKYGIKEWQ